MKKESYICDECGATVERVNPILSKIYNAKINQEKKIGYDCKFSIEKDDPDFHLCSCCTLLTLEKALESVKKYWGKNHDTTN